MQPGPCWFYNFWLQHFLKVDTNNLFLTISQRCMKNYFYLRIRPVSLLFIFFITFPLLSRAQGFGPKTEARLQAAIDAIQNDPAKPFVGGMSVAIKVDGGPEWQGATGYAARNIDPQSNLLPGGVPFTPGTL